MQKDRNAQTCGRDEEVTSRQRLTNCASIVLQKAALGGALDYFRRHPNFLLLALLALAAQIVLPFGHVHASRAEQVTITQGVCVDRAQSHCPIPNGSHNQLCALCAVMGTAGSLIIPTPIALSPLDLDRLRISTRYWSGGKSGGRPLAFQARAPPTSHSS